MSVLFSDIRLRRTSTNGVDLKMITDIEEETLDLDWFSVDDNGELAHLASGGQGFLPPSVKASKTNLNIVTAYFRELIATNGRGIESPNLVSHIQFESNAQRATYLSAFLPMGAKGLHSFDCVLGSRRPNGYFVVARPSTPMTVDDVPDDIRQILNLTRFAGKFRSVDAVEQDQFE